MRTTGRVRTAGPSNAGRRRRGENCPMQDAAEGGSVLPMGNGAGGGEAQEDRGRWREAMRGATARTIAPAGSPKPSPVRGGGVDSIPGLRAPRRRILACRRDPTVLRTQCMSCRIRANPFPAAHCRIPTHPPRSRARRPPNRPNRSCSHSRNHTRIRSHIHIRSHNRTHSRNRIRNRGSPGPGLRHERRAAMRSPRRRPDRNR